VCSEDPRGRRGETRGYSEASQGENEVVYLQGARQIAYGGVEWSPSPCVSASETGGIREKSIWEKGSESQVFKVVSL
jgi:hypothetical protein